MRLSRRAATAPCRAPFRGLTVALVITAAALAAVGSRHARAQEDASGAPALASRVLARALENLNATRHEVVRLTTQSGRRKGFEQEIEIWVQGGDDGFRVLGVFTRPEFMRGTAFLVLPPTDAGFDREAVPSNQYFVYLPALGRVRRITGAQRADQFFGTHLSQGDVEPHPSQHYRIVSIRESRSEGEPVYRLDLEPRFDGGYNRTELTVARRDYAILRVVQRRHGNEPPVRTIEMRRAWMEETGGHVLPRRMVVTNGRGRGTTEAIFVERTLEPEIPDGHFTTSHLARKGN